MQANRRVLVARLEALEGPGPLEPRPGDRVMEFHVSRAARDALGIDSSLFRSTGNLILPDFRAARQLARRINERVDAAILPERAIRAGRLNAMALIDEILHYVAQLFRERAEPAAMTLARAALERGLGKDGLDALLLAFTDRFPPVSVYEGRESAASWLSGSSKVDGAAGGPPTASSPSRSSCCSASRTRTPPSRPSASSSTRRSRRARHARGRGLRGGDRDPRRRASPRCRNSAPTTRTSHDAPQPRRGRALLPARPARLHPQPLGPRPGRKAPAPSRLPRPDPRGGETSLPGAGPDEGLRLLGDGARVRALQPRQGLDAQRRHDGQVEPGLALPALEGLWQGHPDARRDTRRGARRAGLARLQRALAHRPLGAEPRERRDKAPLRQPRGGAPAPIRSSTTRSPWSSAAGPPSSACASAAAGAASTSPPTWCPTTPGIDSAWVRERPQLFLQSEQCPYPGYTFNGRRPLGGRPRGDLDRGPLLRPQATRRSCSSALDRATGGVTYIYHGNDGTGLPWSDTAQIDFLARMPARRSWSESSTSRATSRSSASTPP